MAKRQTIGANPLDAVIPDVTQAAPAPRPAGTTATAVQERPIERSLRKERVTFHLPQELIDRARDAVYWTPGLTLAGLAEDSIRQAIESLEKQRGETFPARKEELRGGRPVK